MSRRWYSWWRDALPSIVGCGVLAALLIGPPAALLVGLLWGEAVRPGGEAAGDPPEPDPLGALGSNGPAVFRAVADGRYREGDPIGVLTTEHPPDLIIPGGSAQFACYRWDSGLRVYTLLVFADHDRLRVAWVLRSPGGGSVRMSPMHLGERHPPLVVVYGAEALLPPGDRDMFQLEYRLGLLAAAGFGGAIFPPWGG